MMRNEMQPAYHEINQLFYASAYDLPLTRCPSDRAFLRFLRIAFSVFIAVPSLIAGAWILVMLAAGR